MFSCGQKITGENKEKLNHWLQIRPLESTARALSTAIYYIHECDLSGVRGGCRGRWWAPTCSVSTTTACQEIKQASSLPSVLLLLSLASPIYEATDPLFLPPWAITWRKCSDVVCERVGLVGGFAALNKSFSSSPTVQKWRCNKNSKESMSFLIRCYCMWDCFSNGVPWPSMCFASVLPHMLTELTQLDMRQICQTNG